MVGWQTASNKKIHIALTEMSICLSCNQHCEYGCRRLFDRHVVVWFHRHSPLFKYVFGCIFVFVHLCLICWLIHDASYAVLLSCWWPIDYACNHACISINTAYQRPLAALIDDVQWPINKHGRWLGTIMNFHVVFNYLWMRWRDRSILCKRGHSHLFGYRSLLLHIDLSP